MIYNNYKQPIQLTIEQQSCIDYKGLKAPNLTVKGAAGSGKSIVILAKAKKFLEEYATDKRNKVVIFSYNNTLSASAREFLDVNGEKGDFIKICTLDSYLNEVFMKMPGRPGYKVIYDNPKMKKSYMEQTLAKHQKKYGKHRFHDLDMDFWLEECLWMRDMNISIDDFVLYKDMPRKGRGGRVRMSAEDRITAFQIYVEYQGLLKQKNLCEWGDRYLYISHNLLNIPEEFKYDHVLIDEAQDQSLAKMMAVVALHKKDMIVAMDMNQRIYNQNWTIKQLGIVATTKKLSIPFRCTKQIDALAESLRKNNEKYLEMEDIGPHEIPAIEGQKPTIIHCREVAHEKYILITLVEEWKKENSSITIGVFGTRKRQLEQYAEWLTDAKIPHEMVMKDQEFSLSKPGVKLATIHSAKGLEFHRVIIPQFEEGKLPKIFEKTDEELIQEELAKARSLAYVGMTRAMQTLVISYSGQPSRFIEEMDRSLYEFKEEVESSATPPVIKDPPKLPIHISQIGSRNSVGAGTSSLNSSLVCYFESNGLEVIDKRPNGGCLWVVGDEKNLQPHLLVVKKLFGAYGKFGAGRTTGQRRGWFTNCTK